VLQQVAVEETMEEDIPVISSEMRVSELADRISAMIGRQRPSSLVILDYDGNLAGIITRGDVLRALDTHPTGDLSVLDAGYAQCDHDDQKQLSARLAFRMSPIVS